MSNEREEDLRPVIRDMETTVHTQEQRYTFENEVEADRFVEELNALIYRWLPWSQAMLGPFASREDCAHEWGPVGLDSWACRRCFATKTSIV